MKWSSILTSWVIGLATQVASILSIIGFYITLPPNTKFPLYAYALVAFAFVAATFLSYREFRGKIKRKIYQRSDIGAIDKFMQGWIADGVRVAIWTRDMSWAESNEEMRDLLLRKARRGELIICLPNATPLSTALGGVGGEVCIYGSDRFADPCSRFTIRHFGQDSAEVAVGRPEGDQHVIEIFGRGAHPAFAVAEDLVALARRGMR